jgi:hypothetical protein
MTSHSRLLTLLGEYAFDDVVSDVLMCICLHSILLCNLVLML